MEAPARAEGDRAPSVGRGGEKTWRGAKSGAIASSSGRFNRPSMPAYQGDWPRNSHTVLSRKRGMLRASSCNSCSKMMSCGERAACRKVKSTLVPMSWKALQPEEGAFNTDALDEWVETLSRKRIPIIAGPLIDLNEGQVPDWLVIWEHDLDTLAELADEFVRRVGHR